MSTFTKASEVAGEVAARMAGITIDNGYLTDCGLKVMRGRRMISDDVVPCVVIAEGLDQVTAGPGRLTTAEIQQTYILIAYHECHPDHPNDKAHDMIKDLKRAMFGDGMTMLNKVRRIDYRGRDIGPRGDGVGIVCASIEIEVSFVEDLTNP